MLQITLVVQSKWSMENEQHLPPRDIHFFETRLTIDPIYPWTFWWQVFSWNPRRSLSARPTAERFTLTLQRPTWQRVCLTGLGREQEGPGGVEGWRYVGESSECWRCWMTCKKGKSSWWSVWKHGSFWDLKDWTLKTTRWQRWRIQMIRTFVFKSRGYGHDGHTGVPAEPSTNSQNALKDIRKSSPSILAATH